jgi:hypothetical protein
VPSQSDSIWRSGEALGDLLLQPPNRYAVKVRFGVTFFAKI